MTKYIITEGEIAIILSSIRRRDYQRVREVLSSLNKLEDNKKMSDEEKKPEEKEEKEKKDTEE